MNPGIRPRRGGIRAAGAGRLLVALSSVAALTVAGCGNPTAAQSPPAGPSSRMAAPEAASPDVRTSPAAPSPATSSSAASSCADRVFAALSEPQRIGQLFMGAVHLSATSTAADLAVLRRTQTGSAVLLGRSHEGLGSARALTDRLQSLRQTTAVAPVGLLVSADQEGGQVQVLAGPGFSRIPAAAVQGQWDDATLRARAAGWAGELNRAGVNLNLAPVSDVVPEAIGTANGPIGRYGRQFGATPGAVGRSTAAYVEGFRGSGVLTTLKHFPGLGTVRGNTDTTADVTDTVLTRGGADMESFRSGIAAGADLVMVSLATYRRIDPAHQAVFSPIVLSGMLRGDLGFQGVVVSDDLGKAAAVRAVAPARRAVEFLAAGGDLVLTADASALPAMTEAVLRAVREDPALRARTEASVRRVLLAKEKAGVLRCGR